MRLQKPYLTNKTADFRTLLATLYRYSKGILELIKTSGFKNIHLDTTITPCISTKIQIKKLVQSIA